MIFKKLINYFRNNNSPQETIFDPKMHRSFDEIESIRNLSTLESNAREWSFNEIPFRSETLLKIDKPEGNFPDGY
jgi:hypothetical protein